MNEKGYSIYVVVEDKYFNYYTDPRIFNFTAYNDIVITKENGQQEYSRVNLEISQCNQYYTSQEPVHIDQHSIDLDILYCLKPNQSQLRGYWGYHYNSFLGIVLSKCVNSTENNNHCLPIEQIEDNLTGGMLSVYSENHILDIDNFESPLKRYFNDIFYALNIDFTFTLNITLKPILFITDSGFILQSINQLSSTYLDDSRILYYGKRGAIVADIFIQLDPLGLKVNRSYSKFQDVLTKIGGLIKAFSVIGSFIVRITSNIEFINDYMHNLTEREADLSRDNYIKNNYIKDNKSINYLIDNNASRQTKEVDKKPSIKKELYQLKKVKDTINKVPNTQNLFIRSITRTNLDYKFKAAFLDFFIQIIPCINNKTNKLRRFGTNIKNKIRHAFSIETLLEKVYMIEVISKMLLDEDQFKKTNKFYIEALKEETNNRECNSIFNLDKLIV